MVALGETKPRLDAHNRVRFYNLNLRGNLVSAESEAFPIGAQGFDIEEMLAHRERVLDGQVEAAMRTIFARLMEHHGAGKSTDVCLEGISEVVATAVETRIRAAQTSGKWTVSKRQVQGNWFLKFEPSRTSRPSGMPDDK